MWDKPDKICQKMFIGIGMALYESYDGRRESASILRMVMVAAGKFGLGQVEGLAVLFDNAAE